MNETLTFGQNALSPSETVAPPVAASWLDRACRTRVLHHLQRLHTGRVQLHEAFAGSTGAPLVSAGHGSADFTATAAITVLDPRFYSEIALHGVLGAGEAYIQGWWTCDDLPALVRILVRNEAVTSGLDRGWTRLTEPLLKLAHWLNRNTRAGSRRNIAAHYDLGNDFFRLFLDDTLMYSAGIFESPDSTLQEASTAKNERICRKLQLTPHDHLLEIGTGWGGFALHAARNFGCRITTTTISRQQYDLARERIRAAGLDHRVTVLLEDYRDLRGTYDKLVSIEMIEAVGHQFFNTYFRQCGQLLAPHGMMLLQGITIADQRLASYRRSVDFIQKYIFPGGCLPSVTELCDSVTRSSDLRLFHLEDIAPHYADTLRHWRRRFLSQRERVEALGYPETFQRMWDYYLSYCEGAFDERRVGCVQMLLTKPLCRRASLVPPLA